MTQATQSQAKIDEQLNSVLIVTRLIMEGKHAGSKTTLRKAVKYWATLAEMLGRELRSITGPVTSGYAVLPEEAEKKVAETA